MRRFLDLLLTTDPVQRLRLKQAVLAMSMLAVAVIGMHYFVWTGVVRGAPVAWWTAFAFGGMALFFALIRSGWSRRLAEPSLTVPQMVYALTCGAAAYALLGPARGGVFPIVMVILMFGMFVVSSRQMAGVTVYAVLLFGATIVVMSIERPQDYPARVEVGHLLMIATMMPAASILAARVAQMRLRLRMRRDELARALERIRELATRDELTGLINRRHMRELMEQERQRCARSGQTYCLAKLDIDDFKRVNEVHGQAAGDAALRALAQEAQRQVRASDVLARWSGEEFMLMLPDTRLLLARGGLERLLQKLAGLRVDAPAGPIAVSLSAGLAEHRAGDSVEQTLERAAAALEEAKAHGGNGVRMG
jgi:diguanylate cyclase (GGDEF)-like protein